MPFNQQLKPHSRKKGYKPAEGNSRAIAGHNRTIPRTRQHVKPRPGDSLRSDRALCCISFVSMIRALPCIYRSKRKPGRFACTATALAFAHRHSHCRNLVAERVHRPFGIAQIVIPMHFLVEQSASRTSSFSSLLRILVLEELHGTRHTRLDVPDPDRACRSQVPSTGYVYSGRFSRSISAGTSLSSEPRITQPKAERVRGRLHRMQCQNRVVLRLRVTIAAIQRKRVGSGYPRPCVAAIAALRCSSSTNTYSSGAVAIYGCPPISARRFLAAGSVTRIADQSFRNWLLAACCATVSRRFDDIVRPAASA